MLKSYWRSETGIFLGIWLLLLIGGRSKFLQDPGTFWHTVVGEQMLSTHELIYHDTFSFTFAGQPWSPHQWLGECIMAALHRLDGLDTLLLATATILAGLYTWLAHRLIRAGLHWSLAAVAVGLTMAASSSHFHIRPHIATIVGMALTFAFLLDFEAGRRSLARMCWLVPIYLVWTNLHGGMLGGLATMGIAYAGWCGLGFIHKESPIRSFSQGIAFAGLLAACASTILINPYGFGMVRIWRTIMAGDLPQIIVEHAPLDPARSDGWIVLAFAVVYVLILVGTLPRRPRIAWLLPIVWFYLTCTRIRHAPLFAIGGMLVIADMLPYNRWAIRIARSGSDLFQLVSIGSQARYSWRSSLIPISVVLLAFVLQTLRLPVPAIGHGWARLEASYWPVHLLPSLQRYQHVNPNGMPIFNEYLFGGFLIYHAPGYRVFVDDRCELYGDDWLKKYVAAEDSGTSRTIADWQAKYGPFSLALTQTGSGFDRHFSNSPEWVAIERTAVAGLYQRKEAAKDTGAGAEATASGVSSTRGR